MPVIIAFNYNFIWRWKSLSRNGYFLTCLAAFGTNGLWHSINSKKNNAEIAKKKLNGEQFLPKTREEKKKIFMEKI